MHYEIAQSKMNIQRTFISEQEPNYKSTVTHSLYSERPIYTKLNKQVYEEAVKKFNSIFIKQKYKGLERVYQQMKDKWESQYHNYNIKPSLIKYGILRAVAQAFEIDN
jgi:hypothetical protein